MAGSQKEFELLFKLKATLGGNFKNTFKQAIDTQKQLQNSLKNVHSIQSKIDSFTKQSAAIDDNRKKLENLSVKHKKITKEIETHKDSIAKLKAEIEKTGDETGELAKQLQKEKDELKESRAALKSNENQTQRTTEKIEEQKKTLNSLGEELRKAGVDTDNLEKSNARLQKSYEKLESSQKTLQKLNEKQQQIKSSIGQTKAQLAGTMGVIGGVATAIYAGPIRAAQEYETALAKVSTIADSAKVPMEAMSKEIMALSNSTGIAATALADDVYNAISAGQDTADAVNFVTYSSKLAKAGFAESAQTLDVLTTILNAYGLEADKVGMVSDMLIQTQNKGKVTVAELSSVMGKIIPTAKSNGVALEQITAGYAIMTAKGIAAAESTTYMNSMLNELGKSGTTADKALRAAAGKGFKELMAEGKSLSEVLNILQEDATKGGKSLADVFGSAEAGKAAVTLLSNGVKGFNEQVKNMLEASDGIGATQTAFELMEQTTEARMQKAKNSISNLMTVIGQTFLPMIGNIAEAITPVITKISEFAQANPKLVQTIAKVVAGLATARVGFLGLKLAGLSSESGIISIIQKLIGLRAGMIENAATSVSFAKKISGAGKGMLSYFGNAGKALGGIAGKILPIVGVITTVITVFQLVKKHLQEIRGFIQKTFGDEALAVFDKVVAIITSIGETIKNIFSDGNIGIARDKIQEIFGDKGVAVFNKIVKILKTVISAVKEVAKAVAENVVPVVEKMFDIVTKEVIPEIVKFVQEAKPIIEQVISGIADFIAVIIPQIGSTIAAIMPIIGEIIGFVSTYVLPFITGLFQYITITVLPVIQSAIEKLLPIIQNVLTTIIPAIQTAVTTIWNAVSPVIQGILEAVQAAMPTIQAVVTIVVNAISGVVDGLKTTLEGIITFISGVFSGDWGKAWEGVKSIFSGVWDTITTVAKSAVNAIIKVINGIISGLNNIKIPDWVPGIGGVGITLEPIPMLAKGSKNTPDTFIAGEAGPELITNAPGRTVFTANQTKDIMAVQNAARAVAAPTIGGAGVQTASTVNTAPVVITRAGVTKNDHMNHIEIHNSPTIVVHENQQDDLEAKLEENNQKLLKQVEDLLDDKEDKEERQRYD